MYCDHLCLEVKRIELNVNIQIDDIWECNLFGFIILTVWFCARFWQQRQAIVPERVVIATGDASDVAEHPLHEATDCRYSFRAAIIFYARQNALSEPIQVAADRDSDGEQIRLLAVNYLASQQSEDNLWQLQNIAPSSMKTLTSRQLEV